MAVKRISNIEQALINECVKDRPDFNKIARLFDMGADVNAVNRYGECVAAIVFRGYCALHGEELRSGYYVPQLIRLFVKHGFDLRKFGLKTISELQNSCYDKYVREGIGLILKLRHKRIKQDIKLSGQRIKALGVRLYRKLA